MSDKYLFSNDYSQIIQTALSIEIFNVPDYLNNQYKIHKESNPKFLENLKLSLLPVEQQVNYRKSMIINRENVEFSEERYINRIKLWIQRKTLEYVKDLTLGANPEFKPTISEKDLPVLQHNLSRLDELLQEDFLTEGTREFIETSKEFIEKRIAVYHEQRNQKIPDYITPPPAPIYSEEDFPKLTISNFNLQDRKLTIKFIEYQVNKRSTFDSRIILLKKMKLAIEGNLKNWGGYGRAFYHPEILELLDREIQKIELDKEEYQLEAKQKKTHSYTLLQYFKHDSERLKKFKTILEDHEYLKNGKATGNLRPKTIRHIVACLEENSLCAKGVRGAILNRMLKSEIGFIGSDSSLQPKFEIKSIQEVDPNIVDMLRPLS